MPELNADFCYKLSMTTIDFQRFWYEKKLMYFHSVATFVYIKRRANTKIDKFWFKKLMLFKTTDVSNSYASLAKQTTTKIFRNKYCTVFSGQNPLLGSNDSTSTLLVISFFNWEE